MLAGRWIPRAAALVAVLALATSCSLPADGPRPEPTLASTPAGAQPDRPTDYEPTEADLIAIRRSLRTRAHAVRTDDRRLFLSVVDRRSPRFVRTQATLFDNLRLLPVAGYSVDVVDDYLVPDRVRGAGPTLAPAAVEHVRLAGIDRAPAGYAVHLTFVKRGNRWLLAGERAPDTQNDSPRTSRPWFGAPIEVASSGPTVVAVDRRHAAKVTELLDSLRSGIAADAALLGVPAEYGVFVDATAQGELGRLNSLNREEDIGAVTFVATTLDVANDAPPRIAGPRIKLNPHQLDQLIGDDRVLRHELTHFLLRNDEGPMPRWVSEGMAEYVAKSPYPPQDWRYRQPAYGRIQKVAGDGPPLSGLFGTTPFEDYTLAWCAVSYLVETFGMGSVREFMGDFRSTPADIYGDDQVNRLIKKHFGITRAQLVAGTAAQARSIGRG